MKKKDRPRKYDASTKFERKKRLNIKTRPRVKFS